MGLQPPVIMYLQKSRLSCHTLCVDTGKEFIGGLFSCEITSGEMPRAAYEGIRSKIAPSSPVAKTLRIANSSFPRLNKGGG